MGGSSSPSNVTQTTKTEVAPQLSPYLAPFMQQASSVAMRPYETYDGQRIAGFTPDQQAGFNMTRQVANQGQQALSGAQGAVNNIMAGGALPGNVTPGQNALLGQNNPYLNSAIDSAMGDVTRRFENSVFNNTDATMARAGAFGGSAWQQAQTENARQLNNELGRVASDMRMADYNLQAQLGESDLARRLAADQFNVNSGLQGTAQQLQAAGMLPGLSQAGYTNAQALLGVGDAIQGQDQGRLDLAYQDWLGGQNYPYQQLDVMGNAIRTVMGGGGTTTQTSPNPYQRNGTASALGGALGGAAAGATFGPWGAGIGAGLGLLGGML